MGWQAGDRHEGGLPRRWKAGRRLDPRDAGKHGIPRVASPPLVQMLDATIRIPELEMMDCAGITDFMQQLAPRYCLKAAHACDHGFRADSGVSTPPREGPQSQLGTSTSNTTTYHRIVPLSVGTRSSGTFSRLFIASLNGFTRSALRSLNGSTTPE